MKSVTVVLTLLVILSTQIACHSTGEIQESLLLIKQSNELPSAGEVGTLSDDKENDEEPDESVNPVKE